MKTSKTDHMLDAVRLALDRQPVPFMKDRMMWLEESAKIDFSQIEARILQSVDTKSNYSRLMAETMSRHIDATLTGRWPNVFEEPPMFTKQHYERVAAMLNAQRKKIRDDQSLDQWEQASRINALNDVVMGFVQMFEADAKGKFRELQFIGACDREPPTEA